MLGVTAITVVALWLLPSPSRDLQLIALALAVGLLGVPHGALDYRAGRQSLQPRTGSWWWLVFGALYVSAALAVLAAWAVAPLLTLIAFLALSAVHFGSDDPAWRPTMSGAAAPLERLGVGALPIVVPCLAWPTEVALVFNWLLPAFSPVPLAGLVTASWGVAVVIGPVVLVRVARLLRAQDSESRLAALEPLALVALCIAAPPLVAFAVYFCGWHSVRHVLELSYRPLGNGAVPGLGGFARAAAPLTALTLVGAAIAAFWIAGSATQLGEVIAPVVFIGLSALTLPHMVVLAGCREVSAATTT
jgi:Brp/Blh family beta-carotene 15,15'-monooxygenase